jgi:hypothetical protein
MYASTIFEQLLQHVPKYKFGRIIEKYGGNKHVKKLHTWNQFIILFYAQATGKESLRDIETGLKTQSNLWSHLGIKTVARSTVAKANEKKTYRVYEELFYAVLQQCKELTGERSFVFSNPLYSLDSTMIELCLSLFDWAHYRRAKGALKLHTLLNNRTLIPEMIVVTTGKHNDGKIAKEHMSILHTLEPYSIIVFDRGYADFEWFAQIDIHDLFFVTRAKKNQLITVHKSNEVVGEGVLADDHVYIGDFSEKQKYTKLLRLVKYHDSIHNNTYSFLTNNFDLPATTIAAIYKDRWQIELFFKWIKQNLKIKSFFGTSPNAVLSQIWVAMIYYLLLVYIKFQTRYDGSLLEFTRMVREKLLMRRSLIDLLSFSSATVEKLKLIDVQQSLF